MQYLIANRKRIERNKRHSNSGGSFGAIARTYLCGSASCSLHARAIKLAMNPIPMPMGTTIQTSVTAHPKPIPRAVKRSLTDRISPDINARERKRSDPPRKGDTKPRISHCCVFGRHSIRLNPSQRIADTIAPRTLKPFRALPISGPNMPGKVKKPTNAAAMAIDMCLGTRRIISFFNTTSKDTETLTGGEASTAG